MALEEGFFLGHRLEKDFVEDGVDVFVGFEGDQIVGTLSGADVVDGHLQLVGDAEDGPAFGCAVELGDDDAVDADHFVESLGLIDGGAALGPVEDQHFPMGSPRQCLVGDADHLFELFGEVGLGMEPAGGVDDDPVEAFGECRLDRIEDDGGGVVSLPGSDDGHLQLLGPAAELFDRCGPESVAGSENDAFALPAIAMGEFGDGRGLPGTVDADDHFDEGVILVGIDPLGFVLEDGDEGVESLDAVDAFGQSFEKTFDQFVVDVRFEKNLFELLFVDLFFLFRDDFFDRFVGFSESFFEKSKHCLILFFVFQLIDECLKHLIGDSSADLHYIFTIFIQNSQWKRVVVGEAMPSSDSVG